MYHMAFDNLKNEYTLLVAVQTVPQATEIFLLWLSLGYILQRKQMTRTPLLLQVAYTRFSSRTTFPSTLNLIANFQNGHEHCRYEIC